ncbi:hypothetical protein Q7C36_000733 [Tachysurus vachellii]|uniref:Uncharacterized protein n=1 Tax=Tachysurus vachellii TaxID=175792 RepID=A0AA88T8F3_TACVA|nr:hypothetical protein Q7C36_000733 [Tachysurus vachellii]
MGLFATFSKKEEDAPVSTSVCIRALKSLMTACAGFIVIFLMQRKPTAHAQGRMPSMSKVRISDPVVVELRNVEEEDNAV